MKKNKRESVKMENPTGFSVIVREFKKDKLALFSFIAVSSFIIIVFMYFCVVSIVVILLGLILHLFY